MIFKVNRHTIKSGRAVTRAEFVIEYPVIRTHAITSVHYYDKYNTLLNI